MRYFLVAALAMVMATSSSGPAFAGKKKNDRPKQRREAKANGDSGAKCGSKDAGMPPVCGANKGCPCDSYPACCDVSGMGGEGIDIESLTPAAQSKKLFGQYQARIKFELPEDAGVYLLDQPMMTPGEKRSFVIPVYDQKKKYEYEIKVDVVRNGKKYFKRVKIKDFRAGMILNVKVESPKVPEGEPIVLVVTPAVEMPGGPAKDDEDDEKDDKDSDGGDEIITTKVPPDPGVRTR